VQGGTDVNTVLRENASQDRPTYIAGVLGKRGGATGEAKQNQEERNISANRGIKGESGRFHRNWTQPWWYRRGGGVNLVLCQ